MLYDIKESYRNVRLVPTDDVDYIGFIMRMADRRPSRGGPRSAGEYLGGVVERCVQHWISKHVPLSENRILAWEQRQKNGRVGPMFRELDGVWHIDDESLCLFEVKLTYAENMQSGVGIRQLNIAADTLYTDPKWKYILKRLVYVASEVVTVLDDLPVVMPDDEFSELGVIWVAPEDVERAAQELDLQLPDNWTEPESREGVIETPEREEWKQYAQSDALEANTELTDEAVADNETPLARALRLATKSK